MNYDFKLSKKEKQRFEEFVDQQIEKTKHHDMFAARFGIEFTYSVVGNLISAKDHELNETISLTDWKD